MSHTKLQYKLKEVSEKLNLSESTVKRLWRTGKLGNVKEGRSVRSTAAQLDAYVKHKEQITGFVSI